MIDPGAFRTEATILRKSRTADGKGGFTHEKAELVKVLVAFQDAGTREREAAAQLGARVDRAIFAPLDADIRRGDSIEAEGVQCRVVSARKRTGDGAGYLYVLATELETE